LRVTGGAAAGPFGRSCFEGAAAPEGAEEEGRGERRELTFKIINFVLLAGGLGYALRKPVSEFLTQRSASIRKGLEEGRKALQASQAQLNAVEEKLRRLEEEIKAFQASATQEIFAERERMRKETAEEAQRILNAARAQMETATRAAQLELKTHAVGQAAQLAEQMIRQRLDEAARRRLVSRFVEGLRN
jgi:F-type H+-transporting ATPase subunit b